MSQNRSIQSVNLRGIPAKRLCYRLVDAIASCASVTDVSVFGSLADDTADLYSDVDFFVAVDRLEDAWLVADIIRKTKPVLFYRMFSSDSQPAGRYWFADQSPLTRLDISFHTAEQLAAITRSRMYLGHAIACRALYRREQACPDTSDVMPALSPAHLTLQITEMETHFGSCIYRLSRAINCAMRSRPYRHRLESCVHDLQQAMSQTEPHRLAGGDGHRLGNLLLELVDQVT